MKKYSKKNNSSRKNDKKLNENSQSKFNLKSPKYSDEDHSNNIINNTKIRSNNTKNKLNASNQKYKKDNNFKIAKNRNFSNKNKHEFSNNFEQKYQNFTKKNFDDWIWGKHSVYAALTSDRSINRIWCTSDIYSSNKFFLLLRDLKLKGVLVEEVSWNRISQLTFGATHQGIALQFSYSKTISLDRLISISRSNSSSPIILALDGITDPHNLGAIIRSAEAFNCSGIIIPQRRSAGITGTVAKVAAGAIEHIPICRVVNLNRALEVLKKDGFLAIGLSGDSQFPISKFFEEAPLVVIIGSEDKGLSLMTQKKCDYILRIPLKGKTNSLNASVAAAISIFYLTNK